MPYKSSVASKLIRWESSEPVNAHAGRAAAATAGAMAPFRGAEFPWVMSGCTFTLTPKHPEVLVVEDLTQDARYNQDAFLQVIQRLLC